MGEFFDAGLATLPPGWHHCAARTRPGGKVTHAS
jgi:hypothetical protein